MKRVFLKNISLIIALILIVYFTANYSGFLKSEAMKLLNVPGSSVQGASTKKAEKVSGKIKSDIEDQIQILQKQALNLTLSDAISSFSRLEKVRNDFNSLKDYTEEKVNDMLKSKK